MNLGRYMELGYIDDVSFIVCALSILWGTVLGAGIMLAVHFNVARRN